MWLSELTSIWSIFVFVYTIIIMIDFICTVNSIAAKDFSSVPLYLRQYSKSHKAFDRPILVRKAPVEK